MLVENLCLVRGEEKPRGDRGKPENELIENFETWNYGDAPYIFGYHAKGALVTFAILYKSTLRNDQNLRIYSESLNVFDLNKLSDRINAMFYIRNICKYSICNDFKTVYKIPIYYFLRNVLMS